MERDVKKSYFQQRIASYSTSYSEEWELLFGGDDFYKQLKNYALRGDLRSSRFRSVCWKLYLDVLPEDKSDWLAVTKKFRSHYACIKDKFLRNPRKEADVDLSFNNPLSQAEDSPWNQYFQDEELKGTIRQDVTRTFPEIEFFQSSAVQEMMTDVLFCYAREYPDLAYKQGMHELLAPLIFVLHCDHQAYLHAKELESLSQDIAVMVDPEYMEGDAFAMFCELMQTVEPWYQTKDLFPQRSQIHDTMTVPLFSRPQDTNPSNVLVNKLNRIQDWLLKKHDTELYVHLEQMDIAPQLYGIRWVRLLFGREFPMQDLLVLWDAIFADSNAFDLVEYMFVAMLIFIRDKLLRSDYPGCLTTLMKYPPVTDIFYIIEKALHLRNPKKFAKPSHYPGQLPSKVSRSTSLNKQAESDVNTSSRVASFKQHIATRPKSLSLSGASSDIKHENSVSKPPKTGSSSHLSHPLQDVEEAGCSPNALTKPFDNPPLAAKQQGKSKKPALPPKVHPTSPVRVTGISRINPMINLKRDKASSSNETTKSDIPKAGKDSFFRKNFLQRSVSKEAVEEWGRDMAVLQSRLTNLESLCTYCSSNMDTHLDNLHKQLQQMQLGLDDDMYVTLAGLKRVRDLLKGTLKFTHSMSDERSAEEMITLDVHGDGKPADHIKLLKDLEIQEVDHSGLTYDPLCDKNADRETLTPSVSDQSSKSCSIVSQSSEAPGLAESYSNTNSSAHKNVSHSGSASSDTSIFSPGTNQFFH